MNTVAGRVVVKESGVGIPDVLVVVNDLDPSSGGGGTAPSPLRGGRLGSRLTGPDGDFEIRYDDADVRPRDGAPRRPDLLLAVLAPDEAGEAGSSVLFVAPAARRAAGRVEHYLVHVPELVLRKSGLEPPAPPALGGEGPERVMARVKEAVAHRAEVDDGLREVAAARVAAVRASARERDTAVERLVTESLTGISPDEAARLRFVPPGEPATGALWRSVNQDIAEVVNPAGALVGYVVLSQEAAAAFRDASGRLRTDVTAEEIEPLLYRTASEAASRVREQPRVAPTQAAIERDLDPDGGAAPATPEAEQPPQPPPLRPEDLPKLVGRLVDGLGAPEATAPGGEPRPTAADVERAVADLKLRSGPADVAALYDFHELQIAFEHVWQHAIDEGVVETATALAREIGERGGDPLRALEGAPDLVRALRAEVRHVGAAQQALAGAGAGASMALRRPFELPPGYGTVPVGTVGTVEPPPLPTPPPLPPRGPGGRPWDDVIPPVLGGGVLQVDSEPRQPHELLDQLAQQLSERYRFEVFAPGTVNFGLLVSYRQRWEPLTYQVGDLVKTLTLAPKETRKVSTKRVVRSERSVKEMEANLRVRKDETSDTMRDEAEIVQKAQGKTTFSLAAQGSYNIGISKGKSTTTFGRDAEASSQEVKKAFREAVLKAAQEFKDERKLEVESKDSTETEVTDSAEITNPNDELTVTYLLYELQRRYRVSEHIHRLTPVVMVAMDVPSPSRKAIDRLLLTHSWIVNRALLDDRYRAPLQYLCTQVVGDELALREMAANVARVRATVESLQGMHRAMVETLQARERTMQAAIEERAARVSGESTEGWGEKAWESVFGSGDGEDVEAAQILEDSRKEAYERAVREEKELRMRLDAETAALSSATEAYAQAYARHGNHLLEIAGLRAHVKENILHYMQAIWDHTFEDQTFFALHKVKAPRLAAREKAYSLAEPERPPVSVVPGPGQVVLEVRAELKLEDGLDPDEDFVTLAEIADLDRPLGYKGNYMIFPLRRSNALTDFMMLPYLDSELGIHDPDGVGSWTPEEFASYARRLQEELRDELPAEELQALRERLRAQYREIVSSPRRATDEVVVPSDSLYIEALPGAHPLLEDFKLAHRGVDVRKVQAEVRRMEMENIRYAARMLGGLLEDPDTERRVIVSGNDVDPVVPVDE